MDPLAFFLHSYCDCGCIIHYIRFLPASIPHCPHRTRVPPSLRQYLMRGRNDVDGDLVGGKKGKIREICELGLQKNGRVPRGLLYCPLPPDQILLVRKYWSDCSDRHSHLAMVGARV